ncbi:MAG: AAA family ATPase [Dehalococcoidia bacterium]
MAQAALRRGALPGPGRHLLDEVDALTPPREMAHEATGRVVATLLENLDGLQPREGVAVLAATNRLDTVDSGVHLAGAVDRLVEVPPPSTPPPASASSRCTSAALRRWLARLWRRPANTAVIKQSAGMSGAEISELVRRTLEEKVRAGAVEGLVTEDDPARRHGAVRVGSARARPPAPRWWAG